MIESGKLKTSGKAGQAANFLLKSHKERTGREAE
jgi:hypothetical protein